MKKFEEMNMEELKEAVNALAALRAHQQRRLKALIASYHSWMDAYLQETNEEARESIWRLITERKNQAQGAWETIEGNRDFNYEDFLKLLHPY